MRLRAFVGPSGTPTRISSAPFDVLENGVTGARWAVADRSLEEPLNDARAALLRTLQARTGKPARPLRQVLVRLPRRLSVTRRAPDWRERKRRGQPVVLSAEGHPVTQPSRDRFGNPGRTVIRESYPREPVVRSWDVILWLRGQGPTGREHGLDIRNGWEMVYPGRGLGRPKGQPRRRRPRLRGQDIRFEIIRDGQVVDSVSPFTDMQVTLDHEVLENEYLGETSTAFTDAFKGKVLTLEGRVTPRPAEENPELPVRLDPPVARTADPDVLTDLTHVAVIETPPELWQTRRNPSFERAVLCWLAYYVDCEEYDRRVCTAGRHGPGGGILPSTGPQTALINRYAQRRRDELQMDLALAGAAGADERARASASRLSHEERLAQLNRAIPPLRDEDIIHSSYPSLVRRSLLAVRLVSDHYLDRLSTPQTHAEMERVAREAVGRILQFSPITSRVNVEVDHFGHANIELSFSLRHASGG